MKVNTEDALSGFQEFLLQPIIKDRSINFISLKIQWNPPKKQQQQIQVEYASEIILKQTVHSSHELHDVT